MNLSLILINGVGEKQAISNRLANSSKTIVFFFLNIDSLEKHFFRIHRRKNAGV